VSCTEDTVSCCAHSFGVRRSFRKGTENAVCSGNNTRVCNLAQTYVVAGSTLQAYPSRSRLLPKRLPGGVTDDVAAGPPSERQAREIGLAALSWQHYPLSRDAAEGRREGPCGFQWRVIMKQCNPQQHRPRARAEPARSVTETRHTVANAIVYRGFHATCWQTLHNRRPRNPNPPAHPSFGRAWLGRALATPLRRQNYAKQASKRGKNTKPQLPSMRFAGAGVYARAGSCRGGPGPYAIGVSRWGPLCSGRGAACGWRAFELEACRLSRGAA
jgi:hypothetical protein